MTAPPLNPSALIRCSRCKREIPRDYWHDHVLNEIDFGKRRLGTPSGPARGLTLTPRVESVSSEAMRLSHAALENL